MALIQSDNVVLFQNVSSATLTPPTGQSYLVKDIEVFNNNANYLKFYNNKTTVGFWRLAGTAGGHLYPADMYTQRPNLMHKLYLDNIFTGYPVVQGENFIMNTDTGTVNAIAVFFDVYDASDLTPTKTNGSQSNEYQFVQYLRASTVTSNNASLYDTQVTPAEFPAFPANASVVPAGYTMTLYGIAGTPVSRSAGVNKTGQYTQYLKFMRERTILFDPTKNGLSFYQPLISNVTGSATLSGVTQIGNNSILDKQPYYKFETPLVFVAGEELDIYLITSYVTTNFTLTPADTEIALIFGVKKS